MKVGNPKNIPAVDWSEFHVWSPNGVYKRLSFDSRSHDCLTAEQSNSGVKSVFVRCRIKLQKQLSDFGLGPTPKPAETTSGKTMDHHHHHHAHKHGIVEEAYVHLFAGALGNVRI